MIKRYPKTARFRVIVNDACFYATARQVRSGVGDFTKCNTAVQKALVALELLRDSHAGRAVSGIAGTWEGLDVQLTVA